jgi:hypothetical protein
MDLNESGPFLRHLLGERNLAGAVPDIVNFSEKSAVATEDVKVL